MNGIELAMVLSSALLHALWNTYAKGSDNPLAYLSVMLATSSALVAPCFLWIDLSAIAPQALQLVGATCVVHALYNGSLTEAYVRGDMSVVYPISRSTPAFVALIAVPLMDDPVSAWGAAGIVVVVVGVWLVHTRGDLRWSAFFAPGVGFAYMTLLLTVAYSLIDKNGVQAMANAPGPIPVAGQYFVLITCGQTLLFAPYALWRVPRGAFRAHLASRRAILLLLGGSVASSISYGLILKALETASVSYVTAVRQSSVLFAAVLAMLWLRERPGFARLAGGALTVVGVALVALLG